MRRDGQAQPLTWEEHEHSAVVIFKSRRCDEDIWRFSFSLQFFSGNWETSSAAELGWRRNLRRNEKCMIGKCMISGQH